MDPVRIWHLHQDHRNTHVALFYICSALLSPLSFDMRVLKTAAGPSGRAPVPARINNKKISARSRGRMVVASARPSETEEVRCIASGSGRGVSETLCRSAIHSSVDPRLAQRSLFTVKVYCVLTFCSQERLVLRRCNQKLGCRNQRTEHCSLSPVDPHTRAHDAARCKYTHCAACQRAARRSAASQVDTCRTFYRSGRSASRACSRSRRRWMSSREQQPAWRRLSSTASQPSLQQQQRWEDS